jgi:hypothetical protein
MRCKLLKDWLFRGRLIRAGRTVTVDYATYLTLVAEGYTLPKGELPKPAKPEPAKPAKVKPQPEPEPEDEPIESVIWDALKVFAPKQP